MAEQCGSMLALRCRSMMILWRAFGPQKTGHQQHPSKHFPQKSHKSTASRSRPVRVRELSPEHLAHSRQLELTCFGSHSELGW